MYEKTIRDSKVTDKDMYLAYVVATVNSVLC